MTVTPAVSVCVALYDKERFVARTIRSVLDQTFGDFELVVLNNASNDRSAEIVASFDDPRIRLLHNTTTISGPDNTVKVSMMARAPLMKIVAADDLLHPTLLERQAEILADPGVAVVSCRQNMVDENDAVMYPDRALRSEDLVGRQERTTVVRRVVRHTGNPVGAYANLMFRRADLEAIGGIPDNPWMAHDLGLAVALLSRGDFHGIPETLVDFRIASGSASADDGEEGLSEQVSYIKTLRRENRPILRLSDTVFSALRLPLMRARHRMIVAAAGPKESPRTRAATTVLALSRAAS